MLIETGKMDVDSKDSTYRTPLTRAIGEEQQATLLGNVISGRKILVRMLLRSTLVELVQSPENIFEAVVAEGDRTGE